MAKKKRSSHSYDYEKAQRQLDKVNASMESNFSWWKAEQGDNLIRVLPPISEDADLPYEEVFLHYGVDNIPITCLGSKCPICVFIKQSGKSKRFNDIRRTRRLFFQIIDRDMEVPEPMIWSAGSMFLQYFLPIFLDVDEYGDVTDFEEGTDIVVNRKGTTKTNTKYNFRIKRNPSPVSEDEEELAEIIEDMVDLSTTSQKLDIDEVDDLLQEYLSGKEIDDDFFDEDEPPQRRKRKKKKPKREVEEEEEEEEEKPKSSSRKKSSDSESASKKKTPRRPRSTKTESEDEGAEEEESDEEDDEPEEKPTPKRKPRKKKEVELEEDEEEEEEEEKSAKKSKSKSSSSNNDLLDDLLEELDGELADEDDDE